MLMLAMAAAGLAALSWLLPSLMLRRLLPALFLVPAGIVVLLHPSLAVVAVAASVPLGPTELLPIGASQAIALTKLAGIAAAGLCALRYGLSRQFNGPALALIAATALAAVFGHPLGGLSFGEGVRSLIGSIAPFAFISARYDRRAYRVMLYALLLAPFGSVVLSALVLPFGIGNGPISAIGRLDGMVHPANLASACITAIMAGTLELMRGDRRVVPLLGLNAAILFGTGARVPLLLVMLFGIAILLVGRSARFGFGEKVKLVALALPVMAGVGVVFGESIIERSFRDAPGGGGFQMSGRDIIWQLYLDVIAASPWFGFGIGSGRVAVSLDEVALLGSNAAHNEYLRLAVDFGAVGVALLILGIGVWVARETARMPRHEALVMRGAAVVLALHSFTDNTLIALTAVLRFAWFAFAFDRARYEAEDRARRRAAWLSRSSGRASGAAAAASA